MKLESQKTASLVSCKGAGGKPSTVQLDAINTLAIEELSADQVYVRTFYLAHNAIDRDGEVLDPKLLKMLAATLPGKGLFIKHPMSWDGDSGPGEGRWFHARVLSMSQDEAREKLREPNLRFPPGEEKAYLLEASMYFAKIDGNEELRLKIDAGIVGDASIGFRHSGREAITDDDGDRVADRLMAPGEALEASLVWLGAQPGARAHKSKQRNPGNPPEDEPVDMKQLKEAAQNLNVKVFTEDELTALRTEVAQEAATNAFKGLGDEGGELTEERVKVLVDCGKQFVDSLIDKAVTAKRQAGQLADDEEAVKAEKVKFAAWPLDALKHFVESLPAAEGAQLGNGEVTKSTGKKPEEKKTEPGKGSAIKNPLLHAGD